jgi:hypothetical protein
MAGLSPAKKGARCIHTGRVLYTFADRDSRRWQVWMSTEESARCVMMARISE